MKIGVDECVGACTREASAVRGGGECAAPSVGVAVLHTRARHVVEQVSIGSTPFALPPLCRRVHLVMR